MGGSLNGFELGFGAALMSQFWRPLLSPKKIDDRLVKLQERHDHVAGEERPQPNRDDDALDISRLPGTRPVRIGDLEAADADRRSERQKVNLQISIKLDVAVRLGGRIATDGSAKHVPIGQPEENGDRQDQRRNQAKEAIERCQPRMPSGEGPARRRRRPRGFGRGRSGGGRGIKGVDGQGFSPLLNPANRSKPKLFPFLWPKLRR